MTASAAGGRPSASFRFSGGQVRRTWLEETAANRAGDKADLSSRGLKSSPLSTSRGVTKVDD